MFDIGFAELALLMLIGLLVLGPERLPRVARTLGLYLRKARNAWGNVKQSIEAELDADELRKALSQVQEQTKSAGEDLKSTLEAEIPFTAGEPESKPGDERPAPSRSKSISNSPANDND
ncbi:MAG: Sec-independent protein translocase protein TatB [Xanthomonadales bacterium]|nr:Sec-independent protein translocase protein TatB [Xanthomonadales bacterium]